MEIQLYRELYISSILTFFVNFAYELSYVMATWHVQ